MLSIFRAWPVKQSAIRFPIYPSCIKGSVCIANKPCLVWAVPFNFRKCEICLDSGLKLVKVNINKECIAAGFNPGKGDRKQVEQKGPIGPSLVNSDFDER